MDKTIEWYDQGITALKKLIKQHDIELEQFINEINSDIEEQKSKVRVEEATGQNKKKVLSKEVNDIDFLIKKYEIKLREYTYRMYTKLGKVRKRLIKDLETEKRLVRIKKRRGIAKEKFRLNTLLTQRQKLKKKLEKQGVKVPVLNLEQIESKIKQEKQVEIERKKNRIELDLEEIEGEDKDKRTVKDKEIKKADIEKIKKTIKVSDRLRMSMMRKALNLDESLFLDKIFDWADSFGFRIDGDYLIIKQDTVSDFIEALDKEFLLWEKRREKI